MKKNIAPQSDAELIRSLVRRIRALETRSTARAGPWVLGELDGKLVASKADGNILALSDAVIIPQNTPSGPDRGVVLEGDPLPGELVIRQVPVNHVAPPVGTFFEDIGESIRDTWNKIFAGYNNDPAAEDKTTLDVQEVMSSVNNGIVVAQESTITLANLANAPKDVPFWVSPNRFEDVAFPRSEIQLVPEVNFGTFTVTYVVSTVSIPVGTVALITITGTYNRVYNTTGFATDGATPPSTVLAGLYRVEQTTGDMTLEYDFGNVSSLIETGAGLTDTRFNTVSDLVSNAGDIWSIGLLPLSAPLVVAANRKATINTIPGVFPRFATAIRTGQSSLPAIVTNANQADTTWRVWACLGQALAEDTTPLLLNESFNAADTANWNPSSWNSFNDGTSFVGLDNNHAYEASPLAILSGRMSSRLCKTLLHLDNHAAEITIGTGWDVNAYGQVTDRAYVRCRNNGTAGVCMHVDDNAGVARVRIATVTTLHQIGTVRATSTGPLTAPVGSKFRIEAAGNVFTCYRNGVPIPGATWTDSGAVTSVGKNFRSVGFGTGTLRDLFGTEQEAAHIDHFTGFDLTT